MLRVEVGVDPDSRIFCQAGRPAIPQVAEARRLPLDADPLVERQRFGELFGRAFQERQHSLL